MIKKLFIFSFLIFQFFTFAQEDAWVYLTDKPTDTYPIVIPENYLTPKAIARKAKHNVAIDVRDVPVNESYITAIKNATGITVMAKSKWFNAVHVRGTETDINNLSTNPATSSFIDHIDFADKSLNTTKISTQNEGLKIKDKFSVERTFVNFTYGNTQNQVEMINADDLHVADYTGDGVTIAVLDASFSNVNTMGAFQRLRDAGNLMGGYDFVNRNVNVYASPGDHGTQVLSTMAGYVLNNYVGTAPDAKYYLFKTEDNNDENPVEESYWVEAAERADSLGVDIINTSLGYKDYPNYPSYSYTASEMDGNTAFVTKGANIAFEKGLLIVTSAGNDGNKVDPTVSAPADSQYVLTIGAVNSAEAYVSFSSVGSATQPSQKPDVAAQGQSAAVINSSNVIGTNNGTSFSSPILAGGIACLMQALPNKTNAEIMQLVRESASQFSAPDYELGYGIPDLWSALNALATDDFENVNDISIYPNPAKNVVHVKIPSNENKLTITFFDVLGKQILQRSINSTYNQIDVSSLSKGIYIVNAKSKNKAKSFKLVKN